MPGGLPSLSSKGCWLLRAKHQEGSKERCGGSSSSPNGKGSRSLRKGLGLARGPWVGKTELRGAGGCGGCRKNGKRGGGSDRDKKEGVEECSYCKKGLTDGMHSKWVPIRRMAWQALLQPPNHLEAQERRRLSGAA